MTNTPLETVAYELAEELEYWPCGPAEAEATLRRVIQQVDETTWQAAWREAISNRNRAS